MHRLEAQTPPTPTPDRPGSGRPRARWWVLLPLAAGILGCEIAPVVSAQELTGRYHDCQRAAGGYCELVVEAKAKDLDKCVADYSYQCLTGAAR